MRRKGCGTPIDGDVGLRSGVEAGEGGACEGQDEASEGRRKCR